MVMQTYRSSCNSVKRRLSKKTAFIVVSQPFFWKLVDLSVSETETQRRIRAEARHFTTKKSGLRICGTAAARDNSG